jgi:hypothetical protein
MSEQEDSCRHTTHTHTHMYTRETHLYRGCTCHCTHHQDNIRTTSGPPEPPEPPEISIMSRAAKSGLAAESQRKIEANYNQDEARKVLNWIQTITQTDEIPSSAGDIDASQDFFHKTLGDGMVLCKLIDSLSPGKVNWKDKTFQVPKIDAMRIMRERERISMFNKLVIGFGVAETYTFPTESLHEKGVLNLSQVCNCIRALGAEAQTKPGYSGPAEFWPKKSQAHKREFTEEQMKAGQNVISLQYGSNKGASQAGMNIGKSRSIND